MIEGTDRTNTLDHRRAERDTRISLFDLQSRRVPVEWFEAVAVTQALCRTLLDSGVEGGNVSLNPSDVVIDSAAAVRFSMNGDEAAEPVVRQIGDLLRLSVADGAFPVPLRLVITQSTSTPPFYSSIAELSSALEYFERPDRQGLIRAVYERAQSCPVVADAANEAARHTHQNKPVKRKHSMSQEKPQRAHIPKAAIAVAAMFIAIAIGAGVIYGLSNRSPRAASIVDLAKGAAQSFASSVAAATSTPSNALVAELPPNGPSDDRSKATRRVARTRKVEANTAPPRTSDVETPPVPQVDAHNNAGETLAPGGDTLADASTERAVYSANDDNVTPPVATYPRIPAELPSGILSEELSTLELLVDETGRVESVRLVGTPDDLGEALLATLNLSAAKTWRFVPAAKNGQPVRYRKRVQIWPVGR